MWITQSYSFLYPADFTEFKQGVEGEGWGVLEVQLEIILYQEDAI